MSKNMTLEELDLMWDTLLQGGGSFVSPRDKNSVSGVRLVGITRPGRHRLKWIDTMAFIASLPPQPNLSILVTAMSVGLDLYDAVYHAEKSGVFDKHEGAVFYAHDYSNIFTQAAHEGVYPQYAIDRGLETTEGVTGGGDDYFEETQYVDYVCVPDRLKNKVRFLPPSNIMTLTGRFDAVFSNIMNPSPAGLSQKLSDLALHFSYRSFRSGFISNEWASHLKGNFDARNSVYSHTLFNALSNRPRLSSNHAIDLPTVLYDPTQYMAHQQKNPATNDGAGFDVDLG